MGRRAVSHVREAVAIGIMFVTWGVLTPFFHLIYRGINRGRDEGAFVEAFALAVCALLIGLLGATGRRWIAVLPALLSLHQVAIGLHWANDLDKLKYGWMFVNAPIRGGWFEPYSPEAVVILGVAAVAWAYGFGRRPWGLVLAGVTALVLLSGRSIAFTVMADQKRSLRSPGVQDWWSAPIESALLYMSAAVIFLLVIGAATLAGSSALRIDASGRVEDPDSGPRGGTIAAVFGLAAILFVVTHLGPIFTTAFFEQLLLTIVVIGAIISARDRRVPVAIAAALVWVYLFLWTSLPAVINGSALRGEWPFVDRIVPDDPSSVDLFLFRLVDGVPILVGVALVWALLRCRRIVDAALATGIIAVSLGMLTGLAIMVRALVTEVVSAVDISMGYVEYQLVYGSMNVLTSAAEVAVIAGVVYLFSRRPENGQESAGAPGAPAVPAQVSQQPYGQGQCGGAAR